MSRLAVPAFPGFTLMRHPAKPYEISRPEVPAGSRRVLDLGCGEGKSLIDAGIAIGAMIAGVDVHYPSLAVARERFPRGNFVMATAEKLPFRGETFDCVISRVGLPYMDIPAALREAQRVMTPGGHLWVKLHGWQFVVEQLGSAIASLNFRGVIYNLYVLVNGATFHWAGRLFRYPLKKKRMESFQTRRSVEVSFPRAGFEIQEIVAGESFVVKAMRPAAAAAKARGAVAGGK